MSEDRVFMHFAGDHRFATQIPHSIDGVGTFTHVGQEEEITDEMLLQHHRPTGRGMKQEWAEMLAGFHSTNLERPKFTVRVEKDRPGTSESPKTDKKPASKGAPR